MFYLIDYDTRVVGCKSKDKAVLTDYIEENDLSLAVALVNSVEELCLQLSIKEASELFTGLTNKGISNSDEQGVMRQVWDALETHSDTIPDYSLPVGKKLLKTAARYSTNDSKDNSKPINKRKSCTSSKRISGDKVLVLGTEPKVGTALGQMYGLVRDNESEMTFNELVEEYLFNTEATEKLARRYVNKSIRLGYLEVKDEI